MILTGIILYLYENKYNKYINNQVITKDTITKYIYNKEIKINKSKGKINILKDSNIITKSFESTFDTIVNKDTISLSYVYPDNNFNLNINKSIDTLKIEREIITNNYENKNWYELIIASIGSLIFGYIIGNK